VSSKKLGGKVRPGVGNTTSGFFYGGGEKGKGGPAAWKVLTDEDAFFNLGTRAVPKLSLGGKVAFPSATWEEDHNSNCRGGALTATGLAIIKIELPLGRQLGISRWVLLAIRSVVYVKFCKIDPQAGKMPNISPRDSSNL
jgi:hypothetical protein